MTPARAAAKETNKETAERQKLSRRIIMANDNDYSGFFRLSFVKCFACGVGQSAKIWI